MITSHVISLHCYFDQLRAWNKFVRPTVGYVTNIRAIKKYLVASVAC